MSRHLEYPNALIAERIQEVFYANDLSDKVVAQKVGLERKTILSYRQGNTNPSIKFIRWICSTYKISANWLLSID